MRSLLYVPGDRPDLAEKAAGLGGPEAPDAIIVDLEDGVAPAARPAARAALAEVVAGLAGAPGQVVVRVDAAAASADTRAAVAAGADGVVLAKATLGGLQALVEEVGDDVPPLSALVECARGVLDVVALAAHPAVERLAIGEADLTAELGVAREDPGRLAPLRLQLVVASAAAGIDAPTGPVDTDFGDLGSFRAGCERLRAEGFGGRSCIHPAQVRVANEVFTPSAGEVAEARAMVEAFDEAVARGEGVVVGPDGRMVDEAVVRAARRILSRAGRP